MSQDIPFISSLFVNPIIQAALIVYFFRKRRNGILSEVVAKRWFYIASSIGTILSSLFGYFSIAAIFNLFGLTIDHGHAGIAYVLPFFEAVIVGLGGLVIGRILIGWKRMKW